MKITTTTLKLAKVSLEGSLSSIRRAHERVPSTSLAEAIKDLEEALTEITTELSIRSDA